MSKILSLELLFDQIKNELEKGNSLCKLLSVLELYAGDDWKQFGFSETSYKRNLINSCDLFELFVICWKPLQQSPIHDHPDSGCIAKVVQGSLEEKCYSLLSNVEKKENPESLKNPESLENPENSKCKIIFQRTLKTGDMAYQQGKRGLHQIQNSSLNENSVSIHIYSPPNYVPKIYNL